jgi:hypothetical protein
MDEENSDNIFDDDPALDFIIYEELEKQNQGQKSGNGGCLGGVVLMLLPVACAVFFWK